MKAWILTYNPEGWPWKDRAEDVRETRGGTPAPDGIWSIHNTKAIEPADRLFLLQQGDNGWGIVGSGFATSTPFRDTHYSDRKRETGYVHLQFDALLTEEEPLDVRAEDAVALRRWNWHLQRSGTGIRGLALRELELAWARHLRELSIRASKTSVKLLSNLNPTDAVEEGRLLKVLRAHRSRESRFRAAKLLHYRRQNGNLACEICRFDFEATYGELGADYAHVHHLRPLSEGRRSTSIKDLAVVCANCHAMIHVGGVTRPLSAILPKRRRRFGRA